MNETTKAITIAVVASAAAAVTTALVTHYLTKQATIQNVASGKTPLPPGSTPTTSGLNPAAPPNSSIAPGTGLQCNPSELLQQAIALSTALNTVPLAPAADSP